MALPSPRFEVFAARTTFGRQRWRWRLVARNGEIIAQSEGYGRREDASDGADTVRLTAGEALIVDVEG